jgi:hypothetical protein
MIEIDSPGLKTIVDSPSIVSDPFGSTVIVPNPEFFMPSMNPSMLEAESKDTEKDPLKQSTV